ncbi:hypothetical protein MTO96_004315 [Rhipicephalus appendiculatus]
MPTCESGSDSPIAWLAHIGACSPLPKRDVFSAEFGPRGSHRKLRGPALSMAKQGTLTPLANLPPSPAREPADGRRGRSARILSRVTDSARPKSYRRAPQRQQEAPGNAARVLSPATPRRKRRRLEQRAHPIHRARDKRPTRGRGRRTL